MSKQTQTSLKIVGALVALCVVGSLGYIGLRKKPAGLQETPSEAAVKKNGHTAKKESKHESGKLDGNRPTGKVVRASSRTTNGVGSAVQQVGRTEDQRKAAEMRDLLDEGNEKEALSMARTLMNSPEADVRSSVVTAIGWVGVKALPELTQMLSDSDKGVADDALTQWKMAFDEISDDAVRAELLISAIGTLKDVDDMQALVLSFSQVSDDLAVQSLVKIIQSNNAAASGVAREHYEFITQVPYTTPEAATQWINENVVRENTVIQ